MFRPHKSSPEEMQEKTIKRFVSNAPEVLALAKSLGLNICGFEYVNSLNPKYGQAESNI